ncbi:MAG: prolipoprotein diacylglyceryl transferase, partial [Pseudomonadota bacterium]|nr:prolipoprotein diacylglyceryl transferase [Pseudomonadota bacterium]
MLHAFLAAMAPDAGLALPWLAEITYPQIDPVLFSIGPIPIRWYSLAYIAGLVLGYLWVRSSLPRTKTVTARAVDDLFLWIIVGVVAGGRLGSVLFYGLQREPERYLSDPMAWVSVWDGGMSFHGGFIGVVLAVILWSRFNPKTNYWEISDLLAISAP